MRLLCAMLTTVVVFTLSACSKPQPRVPVYRVRGQLFVGDRPAVGAVVALHPADGSGDWRTLKPSGSVGHDGAFSTNYFELGDGAPAGEYAVTIHWVGENGGIGPDLFGGKYANPRKPVARVTIRAGDNELAPIRLPRIKLPARPRDSALDES